MPRFDSLANNHFNLLIPNLINAATAYMFNTATGAIRTRNVSEMVISQTRGLSNKKSIWLILCRGWYPVYTEDNIYLGYFAGKQKYREVWW